MLQVFINGLKLVEWNLDCLRPLKIRHSSPPGWLWQPLPNLLVQLFRGPVLQSPPNPPLKQAAHPLQKHLGHQCDAPAVTGNLVQKSDVVTCTWQFSFGGGSTDLRTIWGHGLSGAVIQSEEPRGAFPYFSSLYLHSPDMWTVNCKHL